MENTFTELVVLELGALTIKVVSDAMGRRCLLLPLGDKDMLFPYAQALLVRDALDRGIPFLTQVTHVVEPQEAAE